MLDVAKASGQGSQNLANFLGTFSIGLGLTEVLVPGGLARWMGIPDQRALIRLLGAREIASGIGIFSQRQPAEAVWSRVAGDAMDLALLGSAMALPSTRKDRVALAAAAVLGVAALDVICARQLSREKQHIVRTQSITINRSPEELYNFWHDFENLPRFMTHLESVQVLDGQRSHWKAKAPAGQSVEWDAMLTDDRPGECIAWRSVEGADIENSGIVRFQRAPGGRGTEIHVRLEYKPPAGAVGAAIAKLFGEEPGQQLKDDLYRFKQVIETGEVVQSDASIHRLPHPAQPPTGNEKDLNVQGSQPFGLAA